MKNNNCLNATANQNDCEIILNNFNNKKQESVANNSNQLHSIVQLQNVTTSINSSSYSSKNNKNDHNKQQSPTSTNNKNDILTYKSNNITIVPNGYLIYGPECKIPDIDPFGKDVMTLFYKENHR